MSKVYSPSNTADVRIPVPGLIAQLKDTERKLRKAARELLEAAEEVHEAHKALEKLADIGFNGPS